MNNFKDKKLLILGAGRGQKGLYLAAKKMGIKTIAGTMPDNNPPCIPLADEVCFMNILNPDEVIEKTGSLKFDGVVTCCLDKGLRALGRLCDTHNLIGYPESVADLCNNKFLMKQKIIQHGVKTAQFKKISEESELEDAINQLGGFPVMIKATDLAGSRGIYKVDNMDDALSGFRNSMSATQKEFVIVERCLVGREFGAQAFVQNGNVLFVMPHGDMLFHGVTDVPVGHYVPFDVSSFLNNKITEEAQKAIMAVGLDNCAVNIDFIEENGEVYVLEISGRIGANGLPEVVSGYFGIDYYEMVILAALGIPVESIWDKRMPGTATVSQMIYSADKSGLIESIDYPGCREDYIMDLEFFVVPGSVVNKFENTTHCLGQFVVTGNSVEDCMKKVEDISSKIEINFR